MFGTIPYMDGKDIKQIMRFLKENRLAVGLGSAFFSLTVVGSLAYAVSGIGRHASTAGLQVPAQEQEVATATEGLMPRLIDGVLVASGTEALPAFGVMIDGHIDARPVSGLSKANLVFNVPVEGGITRYMAFFDASNTAEMIGPVRSAREYFLELADGLHAVYGHVGGSPDAIAHIKRMSGFADLDEYFNGRFYWRVEKQSAPHNAYTRMDLLNEAFVSKSWKAGLMEPWKYKDDDLLAVTTTSGTVRGGSAGPSLAYDYVYAVDWSYDAFSNTYARKLGGRLQLDADGTSITAKNVIVMSMPATVVDEKGRLSMSTVGRGKAAIYHDGHVSKAVWRRKDGERPQFETVDGSDVLLDRGTTWVEIVGRTSVFDMDKVMPTGSEAN